MCVVIHLFVRTLWNLHTCNPLIKQRFQLLDQRRFKYMFNLIRLSVDTTRGRVGKVDQIQFPQPMISGGPFCSTGPGIRQTNVVLGIKADEGFA